MQTNSSGVNFGSIKLSSTTMKKSSRELGKLMKKEFRALGYCTEQNPQAIRDAISRDEVVVNFGKDGGASIVAKTKEIERALFIKIKSTIDIWAGLDDDVVASSAAVNKNAGNKVEITRLPEITSGALSEIGPKHLVAPKVPELPKPPLSDYDKALLVKSTTAYSNNQSLGVAPVPVRQFMA